MTKAEARYKIIRSYTVNPYTDRERVTWDVIDTADGFVIDRFELKRDAKAWVDAATADSPSR